MLFKRHIAYPTPNKAERASGTPVPPSIVTQHHSVDPIQSIETIASPLKTETPARIPIVMELETGDPDDILAFLFMLKHPRVDLKGVVMSPGTPDQIGLIKHLLHIYQRPDIPIGAFNLDHPKPTVSNWYRKTFGEFENSREAVNGANLILSTCTPDTVMLCCGPMRNLGKAIELADQDHSRFTLKKVFIQGGFAGKNVVPEAHILEKFKGKEMIHSWNLDAAQSDSLRVLNSSRCQEIRMVSKNVCHGIQWDTGLSEQLKDQGTDMIQRIDGIMTHYRNHKGTPKIIHDIVAASCVLTPNICDWAQISVRHQRKSGWGASPSASSNTFISIAFHSEAFVRTLSEREA